MISLCNTMKITKHTTLVKMSKSILSQTETSILIYDFC